MMDRKINLFFGSLFFKKAYKPIISTWLAASSNKMMSLSLQSGSCFVRLGFSVWCVCLVLRDRFKEMASFQFSSFPSVFLQLPSGGYFCSWLSCRGWKERSGKVLQSASSLQGWLGDKGAVAADFSLAAPSFPCQHLLSSPPWLSSGKVLHSFTLLNDLGPFTTR